MSKLPQIVRAPEAEQGSDEVSVKRKVAEHALVDAQGNVVETEEEANGISYTLLAVPAKPFTWQYGANPAADKMLAIFGAKTLATNETSQARHNSKGEASPDEQIEAVVERFGLIATGKWVDRTREGVGAKIDKDALAGCIVEVAGKSGKTLDYATVRQRLEEDGAFVRTARAVPAIREAYEARVGRATKTLDDVMGALA